MTEKERLTKVLTDLIDDVNTRQKETTNGLMAPQLVCVDEAAQSATFRYEVLPWEANRVGGLHGGIMATMLNHVCGLTVTGYIGHWAPTMSLNMEFIRPANIGDRLLVTATVVSIGRRVIRMCGEIVNEASGKLIATCTASFFNKEA